MPVKVMKETNKESINIDPYYCNIIVSRLAKIGPVTIGHIPRQISRHSFYFLQEGGSITGSVAVIHHGGLEIPILMHVFDKMKDFVEKQLDSITQPFEL